MSLVGMMLFICIIGCLVRLVGWCVSGGVCCLFILCICWLRLRM